MLSRKCREPSGGVYTEDCPVQYIIQEIPEQEKERKRGLGQKDEGENKTDGKGYLH